MEEIGATNTKYQPLRVLWCHSCTHAQKTIPLAPIARLLNGTFIVSRIVGLKSFDICDMIFLHAPL